MSSSAQIRQKLVELSKKRSDHEKRIAEARGRQAKKSEEAASYLQRAARTTSASTAASYARQAESAERTALAEGKKVADESKRVADCSAKEAALNKELGSAIASEASAERRANERRAATERKERDRQATLAKRQHEQELRVERARTSAMLAATENRLSVIMSGRATPRPEPLRILYLTAAAGGDLRVDEEIRRVKAGVRAATHRDLVRIDHRPASTCSDLLDGLTQFRPHVVHFSGHGNEALLIFDTGSDAHGAGQPVTAAAFARAISAVDDPPTLVVLNACKSGDQLSQLLNEVPVAIGMSDSIGDADGMAFAARFYATIADGQSVESAYRVARSQMELIGLADHDLPVLASADGIDPALLVLVVPPDGEFASIA